MQLRPYQQQLVNEIRGQYQLGRKSVLAVLSTGGGKTYIFSYIAQQASIKGNRVLILVHRAELLDQASRSLRSMGVAHGLIQAGKSMDLSRTVQVASVQTVARRLHLLPRDFFQLLVVDEAHHTTAGTWAKVIEHFSQAKLLGVTATPIRGDGRGLGEHYQSMVQGPTAQQLTDEGYLAPARVLAPPGFDSAGLRKRMGDFDTKQAEQRVGTIMGDCLGHYRKHLPGQTAIAFCCSVAHAEAVARLFNDNGVPAASIDGSMDTANRRQLLSDLAIGRIKVLTSCALIGEGVDVPSVGGCILLRPTASVALHLQMIGRCLRPQPGKRAVVLDHVGNTLRLGHHLEPREWSLDGLKKRDREAAPSVKVCPTCFSTSISTAQACRECGHVFAPQEIRELRVVEGELVEVDSSGLYIGAKVNIRFPDGTWSRATQFNGDWRIDSITKHGDVAAKLLRAKDGIVLHREINLKISDVRLRGRHKPPANKATFESLLDLAVKRGYKDPDIWALDVMGGTPDQRREQGKATDLEALRELAQQRGYKRGWAERVYQARLAKRHGMA